MIKKQWAEVVSLVHLAKETVEIVLKNDYISQHAKPGQFVHIAISNHTLRRPISIAATNKDEGTFTILFKIVGSGTDELARCKLGDKLDLLGPNGSNFPSDKISAGSTVLLVGGGIGVPPLYFLANELKDLDVKVHAILGFQSKDYIFYEDKFRQLSDLLIVTEDGSYGEKGLVTDYVDEIDSIDQYFSCGPLPMLKAVKEALTGIEGYLSFEERMGCGIGACYACVIPTRTEEKYKKICQDGPVMAANEVKL